MVEGLTLVLCALASWAMAFSTVSLIPTRFFFFIIIIIIIHLHLITFFFLIFFLLFFSLRPKPIVGEFVLKAGIATEKVDAAAVKYGFGPCLRIPSLYSSWEGSLAYFRNLSQSDKDEILADASGM